MANTRTLQRSFAGGEVSPEMFGRIDDAKYQAGLAKCRNFIAKPQGPVENRSGFAFVREVKDSSKRTRVLPFSYSTTQTMVIELGAWYFRFHTEGGTLMSGGDPYEIANPYAESDLFDIHFVQSADVLTLVHPIGYGHTGPDVRIDMPPISAPVAEAMMQQDAGAFLRASGKLSPGLWLEGEAKHSAIADFCFNLGTTRYKASMLKRRVDVGDWQGAADKLQKWVWGGGRKLPRLVARRAAEGALLR